MAFQLSMHLRKLNNFNSNKNTFFSKISDQEPSMLVLGGSIGTDQKVDVFSNTLGQVFNFDEPSKAIFQQSSDQEPSMLVLDGSIGTDQTIDLVSKNIGKSFDFNRSAKAILQDTTDFEIQKVHSDWFDFTKNSTLAGFKPHKIRRIIDASGDGSLAEVFENGALKINLNSPRRNPFRKIGIGRHGEINLQGAPVQVSIEARDLETGDIIDLGTQSINQTQSSLLVDLKDKINAVSSGSLRDQYSVSVTKFTGSGQQRNVIESFRETITVIKPMQFGSNHLGDETSNDFTYQDFGSAFGSARIFQGRGGTDTLHLDGVDSSDVSFFNGRRSIDAQSASELGKQSFYGGTVFDSLGLNNGDELYLQGVTVAIRRRHHRSHTRSRRPQRQSMEYAGDGREWRLAFQHRLRRRGSGVPGHRIRCQRQRQPRCPQRSRSCELSNRCQQLESVGGSRPSGDERYGRRP
jgi:hypothetical protein